ncbi:hypothetical protein CANARDRAFT_28177 [[Candida] arabinofermentans NRRL YB-2248]|uniref:Uncharacterized protein n=1 Tax=[Candida] arabinofermentans NRRL YB-2248 TaxID=983967 RepID=A0A1E4T0Z0_9ASCO|nr:hypothetical protein CANARDRAFT_28177 [[Candida] arabinofermentans NRRL YB-2248]
MSTPNNREQIKKKQQLQAQFQLSLSQVNSKILSWLPPADPAQQQTTKTIEPELTRSFENLPIIKPGAGLDLSSSKATNATSNSGNKIGDFVNGSGIPTIQNSNSATSTESVALRALKNKLRNDNRGKFQSSKIGKPGNNNNRKSPITNRGNISSRIDTLTHNDDSDDSDDEILLRKSKGGVKAKSVNSKKPF